MKAVLVVLALAAVAALAVPAAVGDDPTPCHRTSFQTKMVKDACKAGGQPAAKLAMKGWVKKARAVAGGDPDLACDSCHSDLAPDFPLQDGALDKFKKLDALLK
ncbi:MAG TPA: hypothetical protein VL172_12410 [Kofleriaceae bacterium]|nr:hypothetical protein [Kofleriaceae bacterium]